MGRGLQLASGRVIALGRLLLATLFLVAIWLDAALPQAPEQTYALLIGYAAFAAVIAAATWKSWWTDAHTAGPAHAIDIGLFTALVYLTEGDKSPFFPFFIFVLLSAAIRWGWRATALTAVLLTILYVIASLATVDAADQTEIGRLVARTGYLVILSLILIWFGVNQWRARMQGAGEKMLEDAPIDPYPLETSLRSATADAGAAAGAFVWWREHKPRATALLLREGELVVTKLDVGAPPAEAAAPFVYDLAARRGLTRDPEGSLRTFDPGERIRGDIASALGLSEGLAIAVHSEGAQGMMFLEQVRRLSTDHIELGQQIAASVATHLRRQALMKAAAESAESRSRLAVARDLHDSVVQFLAGAAFRLEALKRSEASGRDLTPELEELKQLMLQEQGDLRSFITALRSGSQMELAELARDLQGLANRLARQWDIQCTFSVQDDGMTVPARLHLDAQQLVREAVANAVRHAGAKNVSIRLGGAADQLTLDFINDGSAYPRTADGGRMPGSLRERAEAAGGALDLSRGMGVTKISISLPVAGKAA